MSYSWSQNHTSQHMSIRLVEPPTCSSLHMSPGFSSKCFLVLCSWRNFITDWTSSGFTTDLALLTSFLFDFTGSVVRFCEPCFVFLLIFSCPDLAASIFVSVFVLFFTTLLCCFSVGSDAGNGLCFSTPSFCRKLRIWKIQKWQQNVDLYDKTLVLHVKCM